MSRERGPPSVSVLERWTNRAESLESEVYALYYAARDPRTPWDARALVLAVVGYALSPVDPIPDAIPVVGYLDELLVLPLGAALAFRLVPDSVAVDCRTRADEAVDAGRLRWIGVALVLVTWALVGCLLVRQFGPL
jgi:uncharacterized membrane protein YkvA (DUF1232 family)